MFRFYRRRDAEISHQVIKLSKRDISIAFLVRPPRMLKTESYQCFLWCYVFSCFPVSINILLEDICVNGHSLICLTEYSNFKTFLGYLSFIFFFPETEFTSCCYLTTFMAHSMFIKNRIDIAFCWRKLQPYRFDWRDYRYGIETIRWVPLTENLLLIILIYRTVEHLFFIYTKRLLSIRPLKITDFF